MLHDLYRVRINSIFCAVLLAAAPFATGCGGDAATSEPTPQPSQARVVITLSATELYEGDVVTASGVVYDRLGAVVPGATIAWSVSDPRLGEVGADGVITLLRAGALQVTATAGAITQSTTITVRPLLVQSVTINPGTAMLRLEHGDIVPLGVHVQGQGGRTVLGRAVTLTADDPSVAVVDPSGRVRAVSAGTTTLRATADGITGTLRVEVSATNAVLQLTHAGLTRLPMLVHADSVVWDGVREYHEVYLETGELKLLGGAQPRYEVTVRYAEYDVRMVNGRRQMIVRKTQGDDDRGIVQFDARGDLLMTSESTASLRHTASVESGGVRVVFRTPGDNNVLNLFYRREPR